MQIWSHILENHFPGGGGGSNDSGGSACLSESLAELSVNACAPFGRQADFGNCNAIHIIPIICTYTFISRQFHATVVTARVNEFYVLRARLADCKHVFISAVGIYWREAHFKHAEYYSVQHCFGNSYGATAIACFFVLSRLYANSIRRQSM